MKLNYELQMQEIFTQHTEQKLKLLLHACCAPCSSACLEKIAEKAEITLYFYNPNILPEQEYQYRLSELKRFVSEFPQASGIEVIEGEYEPEKFLAFAAELADEPERGKRCQKCIAMRLRKTAEQALTLKADYFATTLTLSPHKDVNFINEAGYCIEAEFGVKWLPTDFKKKEGYKRSIVLSREYCLYRQDYCGCPFSKKNRELEKLQKETP
ncbi:MAG: epoxyqueuosine reductase QueH [Oscillospiraceae bacterium]|nr:epoxyqueuosine reductase QueH [Oscillospiraceae bacterium]